MENYVITISRQYGALGRSVSQVLSRILGIEFWDRDIVEEAAARMGQSLHSVSDMEEREKRSLFSVRRKLSTPNSASYSINDELFHTESNIIRDAVVDSSCIIVGRCGDYVLRDHPRKLSVYLYASMEKRIEYCMTSFDMDAKASEKKIREIDQARSNYRRRYTSGLGEQDLQDMMLDSGRFGVQGTAEIIADTAKKLFF